MKTENSILMKEAREALVGKWGLAIGAFFLYSIIMVALGKLHGFGQVVSLVVTGPMLLGLSMFSLSISRKEDTKLSKIFDGFNYFVNAMKAYLLVLVFTLLWTLLLIIPGIIAAISYSQVFYILADDDSIDAKEALEISKKMMYGYKWKFFCLGLRFIGWAILSILTFGIGFLWLFPYMQISMAKFYDDLLSDESVVVEIEI